MTSLPGALARQIQNAGEALITAFLAVAAATALCFIGIALLVGVVEALRGLRERHQALAKPHLGSLDVVAPWCGRG